MNEIYKRQTNKSTKAQAKASKKEINENNIFNLNAAILVCIWTVECEWDFS